MKNKLSLLLISSTLLIACNKTDKSAEDKKEKNGEQTVFNKEQVAAIEQIAHKYVVNNPEILFEAMRNFEKKAEDKYSAKIKQLLAENKIEIEKTSDIPALGNSNADVTLLIFGDYTDKKSKTLFENFQTVLKEDQKFKVIFRFLPDTSTSAQKTARIAVAMSYQGLFDKFHEKILSVKEELTESSVMDIARNITGVDKVRLEKDVDSSAIKEEILANRTLAEKFSVTKAPLYIIGNVITKQIISSEDLKTVLKELRKPDENKTQ